MKRFLYTLIFFFIGTTFVLAQIQPFNNEWIDFDKTYYRFRIGATGLYRISQSQLAALGLQNTDAAHFQLWKNGEEVPIYTSVASGVLPSNGFIEFWGEINNGKWENRMYLQPRFQINDKYSLFTDSASYFLTVNTNGNNKRYTVVPNDLSSTLPPSNYFMHKAAVYYGNIYNQGFAGVVGSSVYSSSFDEGEGFTSGDIRPATPLTSTQNNLFVATGGPEARLKFSAVGRALNTRSIRVSLNSTVLVEREMNYFNSVIDESATNIPLSLISSNTATLEFRNTSTISTDRMVVGMYELTYPRLFNFGGQANFEFELPANNDGYNLIIDNFNTGGIAPVLFDVTNGQRITAQLITSSQVRVVLPPSANTRKLVLVSMASGNIRTVGAFTQRNFINYANTANQADYLIISNHRLFNDGTGANYVEAYRQYRSSATGGGFNAKIYDVEQIIDQFGWGIKNNSWGIKSFVRFAYYNFNIRPKFLLIIGKGVIFNNYRSLQSNPLIEQLNLVPVYGNPASDNLMVSDIGSVTPLIPVGRINAVNGSEVKAYLDKVIAYEALYNSNSCNVQDEIWKKNMIHISGANDALGNQILYHLNQYKQLATDTLLGADVYTLQKTSVAAVQNIATENVSRLFREGFSLLTYFGHSSPSTLEYNLDDPDAYPAIGKYPIFLVNGCQAGDLFGSNTNRLTGNYIISENWVLSPGRGAIAFIASTHLGIVSYLDILTHEFYRQITRNNYNGAIGVTMQRVIDSVSRVYTLNDFFVRQHLEQMTLHGDPAIKFYGFNKPDYAVLEKDVKISPEFVSIAEASFTANIKISNAGRATQDSVSIKVTRTLPDGSNTVVLERKLRRISNSDSLSISVPIDPFKDKGSNKITVEVDPVNQLDELCETNNTVTKEFFIFEDEIRPVYPYNYSIVNKQNITYYASTANPLGTTRKYYFEIDTTEKFTSPILRRDSVTSAGGSIAFTPAGISFMDSTVFYWRVGLRTQENTPIVWNTASFVYIPGSITGFNQSHYYQYLRNAYKQMVLDSASRTLRFDSVISRLQVRTGIYPYHTSPSIDVSLDFDKIEGYGCSYGSFQFYVFNGNTLKPWINTRMPNGLGRFGSVSPWCNGYDRIFFEYNYYDRSFRKAAMDFMDSIPVNSFVVVTNLGAEGIRSYFDANMLKADETVFGGGNSLYHKLLNAGFTMIDSFRYNLPMIFIYKKGDPTFPVIQMIGQNTEQIVSVLETSKSYTDGFVESPWFGPSKSWQHLYWQGIAKEIPSTDTTSIDIIGRTTAGTQILLGKLRVQTDTSLSFIDAANFPYLKLRLNNKDSLNVSPQDLRYWRLHGAYVPEGAIAPNLRFLFKDTLELGEPLNFAIAFKNISETAFDSLKLKLIITDQNNQPREIQLPKKRPLVAGDSIVVSHTIDTRNLPGSNLLYLMVNPDDDQPEQVYFNNFIYKSFFVKPDNYKPWLDVTFDGVHILNRDIVSSKPEIVIKLKDESKFLALNDTSMLNLQVRYPDGTLRSYVFNTDTVRFTPANLASGENSATVIFRPHFPIDGEYELMVSGTDASGNKAGEMEYKVTFQVINKPMISNLLNYPNPFTTSTAFVFTLTGSEVPQNIRIQILTITGKVVREINKNELGPIRIGRNITEFKWDGTDQYGNKLANGIYLYRVLTNSNGKSLDKFTSEGDTTDKFFNKGYGKMYLFR